MSFSPKTRPLHVGRVAIRNRRPGGRSSSLWSSKPFFRKISRWDSASCSCAGVSCRWCGVTSGWRSMRDSRLSPSKRNFSSEACWSMMKSWSPPDVLREAMMKPRLNWPMTRICEKQDWSNMSPVPAGPSVGLAPPAVANLATSSRDERLLSSARSEDSEKALGKCRLGAAAAEACAVLASLARWRRLWTAAPSSARVTLARTVPPRASRRGPGSGSGAAIPASSTATASAASPVAGTTSPATGATTPRLSDGCGRCCCCCGCCCACQGVGSGCSAFLGDAGGAGSG
mmetsp:Transcript_45057/g.141253  ORF Transcript_45057/g.141253 Transcript_45057/m.141253 type:complete len:287 (+) Transcript_45057:635-1495(+)